MRGRLRVWKIAGKEGKGKEGKGKEGEGKEGIENASKRGRGEKQEVRSER